MRARFRAISIATPEEAVVWNRAFSRINPNETNPNNEKDDLTFFSTRTMRNWIAFSDKIEKALIYA